MNNPQLVARLNGITIGLIIFGMNEEATQDMPDGRSFEERVFARFDAIDARLNNVDARLDNIDGPLQRLESDAERRAIETKPIWERALAEILGVRQGLDNFRNEMNNALRDLSRKIGVLGNDMIQLRADQAHAESRIDDIESKSQQ